MIAVGIDVSKSKSTVAILDSFGTVLATPFNMAHTQPEMNALVSRLKAFDEPVTILLEYTGHKGIHFRLGMCHVERCCQNSTIGIQNGNGALGF